jgi:hypothetical protein
MGVQGQASPGWLPPAHKARWVVHGFKQRPGIDFDQKFSPVVKPVTIRTVLHLAAVRNWPVHQLDVKNTFLHSELSKRVYCLQPAGFIDDQHTDHVCLLSKSLYGLKQALHAWFQRFSMHLRQAGFHATRSDSLLFVYKHGANVAYLLLYVDDIILTASTLAFLHRVVNVLKGMFAMKDLGHLHYFLSIQVRRDRHGFHLHQASYIADVLDHTCMMNCKHASTSVGTKPKSSVGVGKPATDATFYRSIVSALQYLMLTRPGIAYAINQVCLHMHSPYYVHWSLVKRILWYVRGMMSHGIRIHSSSSMAMVAYSDANWAGCPDTRQSTSGYCVFLGDTLVSWSSKRQMVFLVQAPTRDDRLLGTVTMCLLSTSPATRLIIDGQNMLRSTYISFVNWWRSASFMLFMCQLTCNMRTS